MFKRLQTSGAWAIALLVSGCFLVCGELAGQDSDPIDYDTEIQPIFDSRCGGGFCHLDDGASGVDLTSYESVMASVGEQYGRSIVVPFDPASSPLQKKISMDEPEFGERMPRFGPSLPQEIQNVVTRWIDEGAVKSIIRHIRGDADHSLVVDISDAVLILGFLFLGTEPPYCAPAANGNSTGDVDVSDVVYILAYLFLGGPPLAPLTPEERSICDTVNLPPEVQPLGTIVGSEGVALEFNITASDPNGDALTYETESVPAGLEVDEVTGVTTWTPAFGDAGDHRVRFLVRDDGIPSRSATTTGLVRVLQGNHSPTIEGPQDTLYGRELMSFKFTIAASDIEDDTLSFEIPDAPSGSTLDAGTGSFEWTPSIGQAGEYVIECRVTDDGVPPRSTAATVTVIIVGQDSPVNLAPIIPGHDVYRSFSGRSILLAVGASDPDDHDLTYHADDIPAGSRLNATTGVFSWLPRDDQLGPFYVPVTVTDDGLPPESVETILILKISPPDPCVTVDCDPASGCETMPLPLTRDCCGSEPEVRVAEPVADCPEGRVLFVGRNLRGFGRLQNCDRLKVTSFGQGGTTITVHFETRCLNTAFPIQLSFRMESADAVIVNKEFPVSMFPRNDGFAQRLSVIFVTNPSVPIVDLGGEVVRVSAALVDADGIRVQEELRLRLTLLTIGDLPNPDVEDVPAGEIGCVGCHRPLTPTGERKGIEDPHPWYPLACTDCHGGDAAVNTRELAHVSSPTDPVYLRNLTTDQLDSVSLDYLQFVNPSDNRVASRGCGSQSPVNSGSGCHQDIVESNRRSVMSTYAGHYMLPRFLAGTQDRVPIHGAVDIVNPNFDPETAPEGAIGALEALREPDPGAERAAIGTCMDVYIPKSCPTCHLSDFGPNNADGNFRSSGCAACHMLYADNGLSQSQDPMINRDFPPHPITHRLTTAIPTNQCTHCHFQGGRIGLAFQGIREGGFAPEHTPENGVTLGVPLHAHDGDYYFTDEDSTNLIDETPPDLHFQAGFSCTDCHVGSDVHGDGNLYRSERYQVGIRCEDCHGTVRAEIAADPADGLFKNSRGSPLRNIRRTEDNRIMLTLRNTDSELEVPQIYRVLESGVNLAATEAMGINSKGFSHTEKLECYACHTSWRLTCFGCHITVNDSAMGVNNTTGELSKGAISVTRDRYSTEFYALGVNHRDRITPLCSSMSVFMSYIDENGVEQYRDRVRTSSDGNRGLGWNPFHHHTVSRVPQNCDRCHPVAPGAGPDNSATLRETYGFGNGQFTVVDGDGVTHDLSRFLADDGSLIGEFPHPGSGPVPEDVRQRAMGIPVVPHPRN